MLVSLLLESLCLERTGCTNTRAEACVRLTLAITLTLTLKFQEYEYQIVGLVELYPVICSSWRSDTAVNIAVLCFPSVPFHSVK